MPLDKQLADVKYLTVKQLDYLYATEKLGKRQRETLMDILIDELEDIHDYINGDDPRHDELQTMHNGYMKQMYGQEEYDRMEAGMMQQAKNMAEKMFGINLDGIDLNLDSREDEDLLKERMEQRMRELEDEKEMHNRRQANRKTRQSPRAEAQKQEENASLKTLRELYTDLVKKLHPDRERNETLRQEKTEQMKQITEAYERKDLATLLLMQINWLQRTDRDPVAQPEEVLNRYNNVLKMHISKLEDEYRQLAWSPLPFDVGGLSMYSVMEGDIRRLDYYLNRSLRETQACLRQAEELYAAIHTPAGLKQYIREYRQQPILNHDDYGLMDMLAELKNYR
jgi:hypothetical protein